jgi:hypothetical protein
MVEDTVRQRVPICSRYRDPHPAASCRNRARGARLSPYRSPVRQCPRALPPVLQIAGAGLLLTRPAGSPPAGFIFPSRRGILIAHDASPETSCRPRAAEPQSSFHPARGCLLFLASFEPAQSLACPHVRLDSGPDRTARQRGPLRSRREASAVVPAGAFSCRRRRTRPSIRLCALDHHRLRSRRSATCTGRSEHHFSASTTGPATGSVTPSPFPRSSSV